MKCPECGSGMNHHTSKVVMDSLDLNDAFRNQLVEAYSCPHCGFNAARDARQEITGIY